MISILLFVASFSWADERIRSPEVLRSEGYKEVAPLSILQDPELPAPHALPWPVAFQDAAHSLGNSMAQFQPFDSPPYFHGGCDLRTEAGADIVSPVSGRLEAGHYSYSTNPDGSMKKFWKPWPQTGDPTYFEVAVVDENGVRFEFHHVNRRTLPPQIVGILNGRDRLVSAGTLLGHVIRWTGGDYHHTHYNIILPSGIRVNPEFASTLIPDSLAPEILGAYAISQEGRVVDLAPGAKLGFRPKEIVVETQDRQNENEYVHPPVVIKVTFASGQTSGWDFKRTLTTEQGAFPNLPSFFLDSLRTPDGRSHRTEGGYGTGLSLIRLPVPPGASGSFILELQDQAGNSTVRTGTL